MPIKTIESEGRVLAKMIPVSEWAEGVRFFSEDPDYIQVGIWNYKAGKTLGPHIHNEVQRIINRTCEVLFIYQGSIRATIYDNKGKIIDHLLLNKGDTLVLIEGGHGYEILQDGTRVLEVKNGPYLGASVDRRMIVTEQE